MPWWLRRLLGCGLALAVGFGILAFLVWFTDGLGGSLACGKLPARVQGVVVDAKTGLPVAGASLLTLFDPEIVHDTAALERRRNYACDSDARPQSETGHLCPSTATARTHSDGAFTIIVGVGVSSRTGWTGRVLSHYQGTAREPARALLVEKEGYAPLVHETKDARYEERQEGEIIGTLDVGTIRLTPLVPR